MIHGRASLAARRIDVKLVVRLRLLLVPLVSVSVFGLALACGETTDAPASPGDAGSFQNDPLDAMATEPTPGSRPLDAGYSFDGATLRADRFVGSVVSFTPGACSGFGKAAMPDVVFGPPHGAGNQQGGLDVVSLGVGGELVVGFDNAIVDGPGDDFTVFENAFYAGGNPERPAADPAEISVSEDGATWTAFACTATEAPFGSCAGWHPVMASPENGILPTSAEAGGDRFDLSAIGVAKARFVRIRDKGVEPCPTRPVVNLGFDLDAIVIINAERP